jgi:hypothetical protein
MECKGVNGTVEFDGTFVTIKRTGAMARMTAGKGDKRIPVSEINAVQWKPPGTFVRGFISFTVAGATEVKSRVGSRTFDAATDENSVVVGKSQKEEFLDLRQAIEAQIAARSAPPPATRPETTGEDQTPADQLRQLSELHEAGLLTDEEFAAKRAAVIDRL